MPRSVSSNIPLPVNCVKVIILTQTGNFFHLKINTQQSTYKNHKMPLQVGTGILTNPLISPFSPSILPSEVDPPACVISWRKDFKINFQIWLWKKKHVQFEPLSMPEHRKLLVKNYIFGTWSSSCPPPGVKLMSFKQLVTICCKWKVTSSPRDHRQRCWSGPGSGRWSPQPTPPSLPPSSPGPTPGYHPPPSCTSKGKKITGCTSSI